MKVYLKKILQSFLGFERYLFWFSLFKIKTFKWDPHEKDFFLFLDLLEPNSSVLDVGSNIGITTVLLSRAVPGGIVYSFEPVPPNFRTLTKIVKYFKCTNVKLFNFALGDQEEEVEMVLPEVKNVRMQGLSHVVHDKLTDFNEGKRFKANLKRLDDLDFPEGKPLQGIKLDVENFEFFVLRGGKDLLESHLPVVYAELWENENRDRCFKFMLQMGYRIQVGVDKKLVEFQPEIHQTQNFFFLPDAHLRQL